MIRAQADFTVWLVDLTHTQQLITSDVMPAAIGSIATFAECQVELPEPIQLFKYPEKLAEALNRQLPDVIGFSNYVWNFRLSYKFAEVIKRLHPSAVVVFGGPNYPTVPAEQEEFLRRFPLIDFYVVKEGEVGFAELMRRLLTDGGFESVKAGPEIPSVHWVRPDGTVSLPSPAARLRDLTVIPSPYTTGRLDEFFDGKLIPILQTNRGCPFTCTFCVEGVSYYNKVYRNSSEKITAEIDYIGRKMAQVYATQGGRRDLYISDSNFGMYKEDLETCRALAASMDRHGWPEYINTTTGKNNKERILEAARLVRGALRLSGSVQSLDQEVLKNIKRSNISEQQILELAMKASELNANSYSEIILGLPGDSMRAHFDSVRTIVNAGFNNVFTWQLMLLPGSELCTRETRRQYGMVTKFRVLPRCYGHFTVRGEPIVASEIEEVCVANQTLPFDDYLACRRLHLVIAIFYNDTVFKALVKLLKLLGETPFRWLEVMALSPVQGRLKEVFDSFERQTRAELWDDFDALAEFSSLRKTVDRYIAGELGNNLLFIHKTMALTRYIEEVTRFAGETLRTVLHEEGWLTVDVNEFIEDALMYAVCRVQNIFFNRQEPVRATLRYNIPAFEDAHQPSTLADYAHPFPRAYRFALDPNQEDILSRYQAIYGTSLVGISRMLMKLYVSKLFRSAVPDEGTEEPSRREASAYVISGLQESLS